MSAAAGISYDRPDTGIFNVLLLPNAVFSCNPGGLCLHLTKI